HVGDQAPRQAVQSTVLAFVVGPVDAQHLGGVIVLHLHVAVEGLFELALGALDPHLAIRHAHLDAGRDGHGLFADTGHGTFSPYQTVQSSSPPTFSARARRSLMTPRFVLRMAMPSPSSTGRSWVARRYSRSPGRLARLMTRMTFSPS